MPIPIEQTSSSRPLVSSDAPAASSLAALRFDNRFVRELPGDPATDNRSRQVRASCYSRVLPTKVAAPELVAVSREVADLLGVRLGEVEPDALARVFAGNELLSGMQPYAACYGGHQFGNWAGQLGDGRAISLGEVVSPRGQFELQLKGAGRTPYSRTADGRAVLRSSVREFLCSEAMHHLGVPTTRALCLVTTGEQVMRDILYDGRARLEPGAVVCRVAPSFIRFGNFEIFAARGEHEVLKALADYTLRHHFPELGSPSPEAYLALLNEVCRRTAEMIVHWMRVGFVHGVMNTDNMSIHGLTIDYGPYGWLEPYDPSWTPNTTDAAGRRYRYGNQPQVAAWNLARLAEALHPLVGSVKPLEEALDGYAKALGAGLSRMYADKLGLVTFHEEERFHGDGALSPDPQLVDELFEVLALVETDMTIFFRKLADVPSERADELSDDALLAYVSDAYYAQAELPAQAQARMAAWLRRYVRRVRAEGRSDDARKSAMNRVNPKYVLRNYLAQLAIDKAESGDPSGVHELLDVLRHPYDEQPDKESYGKKRPEWARNRVGCSMLSCSS